MALTVRPDDEVYQFDTVWLGPDEYTLPIQARYVAWGTWLACFLVCAAVLIPVGGDGPAGVLGSIVWSLAVSVVLSRAVMLVVDHERPLRSLPALFSAEARAALAARRRGERALLVRPGTVRVRPTPEKVLAIRERQRGRRQRRADRRPEPAPAPVEAVDQPPDEARHGADIVRPEWTPELPAAAGGQDGPAPGWSVPTGEPPEGEPPTGHPSVPAVPAVTVALPALLGLPRRWWPGTATPGAPAGRTRRHPPSAARTGVRRASTGTAAAPEPRPAGRPPAPTEPEDEPRPYAGPVTVTPNGSRDTNGTGRGGSDPRDRQAAVEARILLPARKDTS